MKYLIAVLISILIVSKNFPSSDRCDLGIARNALPPRIFAETTIDGSDQPPVVTRFFHNKATILLNELARCYFNFFDLNFVANSTALVGLLPWLYFFYKSSSRPFIMIPFLAFPLLPIFSEILVPIAYIHKIFAIIGLVYFVKRTND